MGADINRGTTIWLRSFSFSLTDIITDKVNGFAIPNDDISLYIKQMKLLMTDEKLRKSMSANAIESSKQFSIEIIIKKWMEVINE